MSDFCLSDKRNDMDSCERHFYYSEEDGMGRSSMNGGETMGSVMIPFFFVPDLKLTAAELPPAIKNKISHRGQAFAKLKKVFAEKLKN